MSILFRDFTNDDYIGTRSAKPIRACLTIAGANTVMYHLYAMERCMVMGYKLAGIPGREKSGDQDLLCQNFLNTEVLGRFNLRAPVGNFPPNTGLDLHNPTMPSGRTL